ncbi:MAG: MOSC domain-containing protein [Calditrichaeota bacterium]|nr:MOSC domain-containing protein [Calditrichota bacterium]
MGYIEAICISPKKGIVKKEIPAANFIENYGIEGDAHAGDWHRQVSLLPAESIDRVKEKIPALTSGAFAENVIVRGVNFSGIKVGDRFKIGDSILLEVTQIGKECHTACAIKRLTGDCIMPREGVFARVLRGGKANAGDVIERLSKEEPKAVVA